METRIKDDFVAEAIPKSMPVVPAIDVTVFPNTIMPLLVLDERIIQGINYAINSNNLILLLSAKTEGKESDEIKEIDTDTLYSVGTVASIMRMIKVPEGGIKILIQGVSRASVSSIETQDGILIAHIQEMSFIQDENGDEAKALIKNIKEISEQLSLSSQSFSPDFHAILSKMQNPEKIAEFILSHMELDAATGQALLEKTSLTELLEGIYQELNKEIAVSKVQERIRNKTREAINKNQNEYYLREQMRTIKKELGEDSSEEIEQMRINLAKKEIPEANKKELERQLSRLESMPPESMEAAVTRNHIETVLSLPWGNYSQDNIDINHAKIILDEDHFGLDDVKDRILDFISIKNLKKDGASPILCFSGAPGVGKTSLAASIARSLGRTFQRISLGGVKDESEIRGHRKTYVGALPGRFIQAIKKSGSMNPVILIDEIDKIGADFKGDPSAALLEILDPQQNHDFYDNYLGMPFDLSKVMFIATANDLSKISGPLRDRMEIIELSGYTLEEKSEIARRHIIKKTLLETGLEEHSIVFSKGVVDSLIKNYTRESGVRNLTQVIKRLCSKVARHFVEKQKIVIITEQNLEKYLGPYIFINDILSTEDLVGITNGLGWTAHGGEVLKIEAMLMKGSGKLTLTGQLGDVMKESAQAALSYARAHAEEFDISHSLFQEYDLHIHVPAGGIPKDGPSAGITMLSSILSAYTNRPINARYAMTGELNLRGDIMPIGGVKEKILAAKRNNLTAVFLPEQNQNEFEKVKDLVKGIEVIWVKHANQVLDKVLMPKKKVT